MKKTYAVCAGRGFPEGQHLDEASCIVPETHSRNKDPLSHCKSKVEYLCPFFHLRVVFAMIGIKQRGRISITWKGRLLFLQSPTKDILARNVIPINNL